MGPMLVQLRYFFKINPANYPGWITGYNGPGRYIMSDYAARPNDGSLTYCHTT